MNYMERLERAKKFVNTDEAKMLLGNKKGLFTNIVYFVERDAKLAEEEKEIPHINMKLKDIDEALRFIRGYMLEKPLTKVFQGFMKDVLFFIYNWNENISKNQDIKERVVLLDRMIDMHFTMVEASENLKLIFNKVRLLLNQNPTKVELSRHYLESLMEV